MRKSFLFLLGFLFFYSNLSHAQVDDNKLIRELTQTWVDVTNNEDIDGLLNILTSDIIIFSPNAEPIKSKSSVKEIYNPYYKAYDLEITADINEIQVSGALAYIWALVEGTRTQRDNNKIENFVYNNLWVLKKNQSGWKLWRLMFNSPS
jgi:ketosteroid isomerase-like protein